ncbi:hypothetical protein ACIBW9_18905 [Streptomyces sp. NPDC049541]|uniref:hypothetical protein n=1 Tax=Streptomyces sp. NPDC049541 TaxID=3365594 RepID=UPI0037BB91CD
MAALDADRSADRTCLYAVALNWYERLLGTVPAFFPTTRKPSGNSRNTCTSTSNTVPATGRQRVRLRRRSSCAVSSLTGRLKQLFLVCGGLTGRRTQRPGLCRPVAVNRPERAHSMVLDPNFCLDVPPGFDDSDAESGVHPMARKLFPATTAAEAFKKAHEWVRDQSIHLVDVSWDFFHDEEEPYCLSIYFTFDLDPEDS